MTLLLVLRNLKDVRELATGNAAPARGGIPQEILSRLTVSSGKSTYMTLILGKQHGVHLSLAIKFPIRSVRSVGGKR